jgi:hypothetical protein
MRILAQLSGTLLLLGFVLKYWWVIALVLAVIAAWKYAPGIWARHQAAVAAEQRRLAAIAARADQQHAWIMAGDPRGTYGAEITRSN